MDVMKNEPTAWQQYRTNPKYAHISDDELASTLHRIAYSDIPRAEFDMRMGIKKNDYGFMDEVHQGAALGHDDELSSVARAAGGWVGDKLAGNPTSFNADRQKFLEQSRAEQKLYREENPGKAFTANVTGSAVTGGGGYKLATKTIKNPTLARTVTGAVGGGVAGMGEGEGFEGKVWGAMVGSSAGAGLAYAVPAAAGAVGRTVRGLYNSFGFGDIPNAATRRIIQAMERDGLTPEQAAENLRAMYETGHPGNMGDLGPNLRSLLSYTAKQPGQGRNIIEEALEGRQFGQIDRITGRLKNYLSGDDADFHADMDSLVKMRRTTATPLYEEAYNQNFIWSDTLETLMKRPSIKKAARKALELADEEGVDPKALGIDFDAAGNVKFIETPSMQTMDYIKRGLDDVVEKYRDKTTRKLVLDGKGGLVNNTRAELVDELKKLNPAYEKALNAYSGHSGSIEALEMGRKFMRMDAEQIKRLLNNMPDGDKDFYRQGVVKGLMDMMNKAGDGANKARNIFGTPAKRKALRVLFRNDVEFDEFERAMKYEMDMHKTYSKAMGGSPTQPLQAEGVESGRSALDIGGNIAANNWLGVARGLVNAGLERSRGVGAETSDEIANIMLGKHKPTRSYYKDLNVTPKLPLSPTLGLVGSSYLSRKR